MIEIDLLAEADRQFTACNACRYCEGFCAVFPAAEKRQSFGAADVAYLANLCHDCRMCWDACPFTPPHVYGIDIPRLLAAERVQTYERFSFPRRLGVLFRIPATGTATIGALALAAILAGIAATSGAATLVTSHDGPGAFYRIVSFPLLVGVALVLSVVGIAASALGAFSFAREIGVPSQPRAFARAARDALRMTYLRGGGAGCYDTGRNSSKRRLFHGLVFWGFVAAFASTTAAGIEQDVFGILPPFALLSVPVVLGLGGGIALLAGALGLIAVKGASDPEPASRRMLVLDYVFLVVLALVAATGLAVLALRATPLLGATLAVHLATLVALYVTAPYGKFVHGIYRYLSLVKYASEEGVT